MAVRIERQAEPIPGYKLIDRLGGGGFGEVWRCEAPGGLHKAIKFVFGDLQSAGDKDGHRAEQELKALSRVKTVRHPYILSLERYDIIDGQLIIVMELADRNLWDRYKECRVQGLPGIPRDELLGYMKETAEALDLMNNQYQLQHLDIKPQNLFLVHSHVKVADFGLVKDLEGMQASVTGGVTPVYAAPETFDGWVSRFSDQYSLAIVYQELLTGVRPFAGTNVRQLILQHLQTPPNLSPLPPGDQPIIGRALAKNPDERFPLVREMVEALVAASGTPAGSVQDAVTPAAAISPSSRLASSGKSGALAKPPESAPTSSIRARTTDAPRSATPGSRVIEPLSGSSSGIKSFRHTAAQEIQGDGVLFPALVLGVGGVGTAVLQRLRECLHARLGSLEPLTSLRLLALDTDPEATKAAMRGNSVAALSYDDVIVATLNRPSHYIKPREGKPPVGSWLKQQMVFRIPRTQVTMGVRALGRLAFCDHYRTIARRLQTELEELLNPDTLTTAAEQTGLGLRTNRPRVYILASLCGGTGSGMFLDLAYTVRALLRRAGFEQPDVVGLLLVPTVDRNAPPSMGLGNTYAALTELHYFGAPSTRFTARYHDQEEALDDPNPPFSRCILLPLPEENDTAAVRELMEMAGQYLAQDLCSPLGRVVDLGRAELSGPPWDSRGQFYQTFGLFRLHRPRAALLRAVARRLCHQLIQRWMSKDGKPIREAVRAWVREEWSVLDLDVENFINQLQSQYVKALGKPAEEVFGAVAAAIAERLEERVRTARRGSPPPEIPLEEVADALQELAALLGKPTDDKLTVTTGTLAIPLRETAEQLGRVWGQRLTELPIRLIEDPRYRLAGAEEAVRHMVATIELVLQRHEPLIKELAGKATEAYTRLRALLAPPKPGGKRYTLPNKDILELLRCYPKWRFQSLLMQQVANAFVGMRGHLSDELREINFCRVRLTELGRCFETKPTAAPTPDENQQTPTGRCLFPTGCRDLEEAVALHLEQISPEELCELDTQIQAVLKERFTALVNICLTNANLLKNVEEAMLETAEAFAAARLPWSDVAQMFFEKYAEEDHALAEVECFYGEASPELAPRKAAKSAELCVLATPPGEDSERFRNLFHEAMPNVEFHPADSSDDILIYREQSYLPLLELEQLGPAGLEAYQQMSAMDKFTPHSRCDIEFVSQD